MKIQSLAVIFIIIILPISLILTSYVQNQVKTLELQVSYDTKLTNATYDALKAFQINTLRSDTSDQENSKIRDIQASINSFYNSISNQFKISGYSRDLLENYVPALVYTMYDGYYIYSPFKNTLPEEESNEGLYKDGEKIYGLKPYVHYSCRYKGSNFDVVITYTLDNYITVQGIINNVAVDRSGYLLDNIDIIGTSVKYRDIEIKPEEELKAYIDGNVGDEYTYIMFNGVKYYKGQDGKWFTLLNGDKEIQQGIDYKETTSAGLKYYQEAYDFTKWIRQESGLGNLKVSDAVDETGTQKIADNMDWGNYEIFKKDNNISIEDSNSNFNMHRLQIIKYSIEKNLSIAIANYNNYTDVATNFQMPVLNDAEWEKILGTPSIISFLQGLSIGGKIYNGYSIVTNSETKEVVQENSIYITTNDGQYHKITDTDLIEANNSGTIAGAYLNIDFEMKYINQNDANGDTQQLFYLPRRELKCYSTLTSASSRTDDNTNNIYQFIAEQGGELARTYFTALGRERYSMYRTNNDPEELRQEFIN